MVVSPILKWGMQMVDLPGFLEGPGADDYSRVAYDEIWHSDSQMIENFEDQNYPDILNIDGYYYLCYEYFDGSDD